MPLTSFLFSRLKIVINTKYNMEEPTLVSTFLRNRVTIKTTNNNSISGFGHNEFLLKFQLSLTVHSIISC